MSSNFTFRVTDNLKAALVEAARVSGRSVAGEAVFRLETFDMQIELAALRIALNKGAQSDEIPDAETPL
jgi:hypothetical protein